MDTREDADALNLAAFWLAAGPERWFTIDDAFDRSCRDWVQFWERAHADGLTHWQRTAVGSFAYIVLTDQIPRNVFRGEAQQFSTDGLALSAARHAVAHGHDKAHAMPARNIYYLPYQHAEDLAAQEEGLDLYRAAGNREAYYWALVHHDTIRRFGRFPHRNDVLGRPTSEAEAAYLTSGGFDG